MIICIANNAFPCSAADAFEEPRYMYSAQIAQILVKIVSLASEARVTLLWSKLSFGNMLTELLDPQSSDASEIALASHILTLFKVAICIQTLALASRRCIASFTIRPDLMKRKRDGMLAFKQLSCVVPDSLRSTYRLTLFSNLSTKPTLSSKDPR